MTYHAYAGNIGIKCYIASNENSSPPPPPLKCIKEPHAYSHFLRKGCNVFGKISRDTPGSEFLNHRQASEAVRVMSMEV